MDDENRARVLDFSNAGSEDMQEHRAQFGPEQARIMEIRDHAQEIACREAGEIVRWQQVIAAADAMTAAAFHYIRYTLPAPRSSVQNAEDRACAFDRVEDLLLRVIAAVRFPSWDDPTPEQVGKVVASIAERSASK
jgi:hypothetical protein